MMGTTSSCAMSVMNVKLKSWLDSDLTFLRITNLRSPSRKIEVKTLLGWLARLPLKSANKRPHSHTIAPAIWRLARGRRLACARRVNIRAGHMPPAHENGRYCTFVFKDHANAADARLPRVICAGDLVPCGSWPAMSPHNGRGLRGIPGGHSSAGRFQPPRSAAAR